MGPASSAISPVLWASLGSSKSRLPGGISGQTKLGRTSAASLLPHPNPPSSILDKSYSGCAPFLQKSDAHRKIPMTFPDPILIGRGRHFNDIVKKSSDTG